MNPQCCAVVIVQFRQSLCATIFSLVVLETAGGGLVNPKTVLISSLAIGVTPLGVKANLSMYCCGGRSETLCVLRNSPTRLFRLPTCTKKASRQKMARTAHPSDEEYALAAANTAHYFTETAITITDPYPNVIQSCGG